jgi:hypothetical protein
MGGGIVGTGGGAFDEIEGTVGPEVGGEKFVDGAAFDDGAFVHDSQSDAFHEIAKIAHRHEVDVGSFVPFPGEGFSYRSAAATKHFETNSPVPKVWYNNKASFGNTKHFGEQSARVTDLLERLAEHGEVEGVTGDFIEAAVEVGLNGGEAALDDVEQIFLFDFNAEHIAAGLSVEAFEQPSVAAAEVDYAAAASDVLHNEFVREADGRIGNLVAGAL